MKSLLFLALMSLAFSSFAQKPPIKFGDVTVEELKEKIYPKDSSAGAYVIADFGESNLTYNQSVGFRIEFGRIKRIKILNKSGYSAADFIIPLYHTAKNDERLTGLKAVTYNLEGGKIVETKMKNDAIFKEKVDNNIDYVKFTLPNVKEGSVLEVTYDVSSEFLFNFQDWEFQSTIPIKWSEYRTRIPEYFDYQKYMQGYVGLTVNETKTSSESITLTSKERSEGKVAQTTFETEQVRYTRTDSRWAAKDVPAFKEEAYMNNTRDYMSKINFELAYIRMPGRPADSYMSSWESLNTEFLESANFGDVVSGSGFLKDITAGVVGGSSDVAEKTGKIYAYVKNNVEWDGLYRKYVDENFKKVLDNKKGNSAEINLLLTSMLQKAGVSAWPVLVSTRNHGFIRKEYPVSSQFNYVICGALIGDKMILLDATDRSLPMKMLPERCLNGEGFLISKDRPGWINIVADYKSRTVLNYELSISPETEMTGKISVARDGYDAQRMRRDFMTKGEKTYVGDLSSAQGWELQNSKFENTDKISESVTESHELKVNEHIQMAGDVMYLNPFLSGQLKENPFKAESRVYPVDYGSPQETFLMGKFTLPSGFVAEELPKPRMILLPNGGGKYVYNVVQAGDKIQFTSQLLINKPLFAQEEYANLREFYNQVVAKQAEQIVIKKK